MKRDAGSALDPLMKLRELVLLFGVVAGSLGVVAEAGAAGNCEDWNCGENVPDIPAVYFWELDLDVHSDSGKPVELVRYAISDWHLDKGFVHPLDVAGKVFDAPNGGVGGVMEVDVNGKKYRIKIYERHTNTEFWTEDHGPLITYTLKYRDPALGDNYKNLCNSVGPLPGFKYLSDAIIFEGERYNPYTREVTDDLSPQGRNWFNIACAGSMQAKLFLLRRTLASGHPGALPSLEERQAYVNLMSANYCGDGTPYTVPKERIAIRDDDLIENQPTVGFASFDDVQTEAVWDEHGAVCLDVARREADDPGITVRARIHCANVYHPLPPCQALFGAAGPASWASHGIVYSGIP